VIAGTSLVRVVDPSRAGAGATGFRMALFLLSYIATWGTP